MMVMAAPLSMQPHVYADKYDDQIKALQQELDSYQAEAKKLKDAASSLQAKISVLSNQKAQIQGQIELSQAKFNKLSEQIVATEKKISDSRAVLGETLASLYIDDQISPLEMLASSKNISDYVDKQEYRSSIRDQLSSYIDKIKGLKISLESQKTDVARVLGDQKNAQKALAEKQSEQSAILAATQGRESSYMQLSAETNAKKLEVQKQQQAAIEAAMFAASGGGAVNILPGDPDKGGYPWEAGCTVDADAVSHGGYDGNGADPLGW